MKRKFTHALVWLYLLTKRLLKKPVFLLTLVLIPIMAFAMNEFAKEESSIVRVGLYTADEDAVAEHIITQLLHSDSVVQYQRYDSETSAVDAVKNGEIDSAWGFSKDFSRILKKYAHSMRSNDPLIYVSEQEETMTLRLAREQLYSEIIPHLSREIYFAYLADKLGYDVEAHRDELEEQYEKAKPSDELIHFEFLDQKTDLLSVRYLSTPIRGIVAVIMLICGIAAAMVFLHEKEKGIYSYLSGRKQFPVLLASCFTALVICGIVAFVSIKLSGNFTTWGMEILLMGLYIIMCTLVCSLLAQICRTSSALAIFLPVLVVLSLVFCPVFLNHKIGRPIQMLLPTYYYLNAVSAERFIPQILIYILVCGILCVIAEEISRFTWLRSFGKAHGHDD